MEKHSVTINGHATSVSLEPEFWDELRHLAAAEQISLAGLISRIDRQRTGGLSGALRLYVLESLRQEAGR